MPEDYYDRVKDLFVGIEWGYKFRPPSESLIRSLCDNELEGCERASNERLRELIAEAMKKREVKDDANREPKG